MIEDYIQFNDMDCLIIGMNAFDIFTHIQSVFSLIEDGIMVESVLSSHPLFRLCIEVSHLLFLGGNKTMQDSYLLKLCSGMNALFHQKYGVDPSLVADTYYCNFQKEGGYNHDITSLY